MLLEKKPRKTAVFNLLSSRGAYVRSIHYTFVLLVTRVSCTQRCPCEEQWHVPALRAREQSSSAGVERVTPGSLTPGEQKSHSLPVHSLHQCSAHQLRRNLREKGIACFGYSCGISAVGCWMLAVFCSTCVGHLPLSACLPLQLLQSLHRSPSHGPHLSSGNLFILARSSPWKRGQNKPHVSFNDILNISITGRFLYSIEYACMSKWKVYVKKKKTTTFFDRLVFSLFLKIHFTGSVGGRALLVFCFWNRLFSAFVCSHRTKKSISWLSLNCGNFKPARLCKQNILLANLIIFTIVQT